MSTHTWTHPVCGAGDIVEAKMHQGLIGPAEVSLVETRYTKDRAAYHSYYVRFIGHTRHQWLPEQNIIKVTVEASHG